MLIDILSEQHYGEYGGDPYESRVYKGNIEVKDINELYKVCKDFLEKEQPSVTVISLKTKWSDMTFPTSSILR